jgi:two-component system, LytTR family, response regulator
MSKLRAIIIDDELAGVETLKVLAQRNENNIRIVASSTNPEEGLLLIEDYKPDVVFLDISMPSMSGFELLKKLEYKNFKLVFTTAHKDYAIEAIKNGASDYLLKPISNEDYKNCVDRLLKDFPKQTNHNNPDINPLIEIMVKDGIQFIKQHSIIRLEACRSYTEFYLDNGQKHVASKSLIEFESKLDHHLFYRCHKSHIINLSKVQKFVNHDGYFALMTDGSMVDISKNNKDIFLVRLKVGT